MPEEELIIPDPGGVRTVADLGRQLALLRLTASRPTREDDPLTLRQMAETTGLPRSTLGNAESGRVLPRTAVVYRFVRACGVSDREADRWTRARDRLAHAGRERRRDQRYDLAENVAKQLAENTDRVPLQMALDHVRDNSIASTVADLGRTLDALPAQRLAGLLEGMPVEAAVECVHVIAPDRTAAGFEYLTAVRAAQILESEDAAMAAEHLPLLGDFTARRALLLLSAEAVSRILEWMPREQAEALAAKMPAEWVGTLVTDSAVSVGLAADLLFLLPREHCLRLIDNLSMTRYVALLSSMDADPAAGLVSGLPSTQIKTLLAAMPPERASRIVASLMPDSAAALIRDLPAPAAAALLAAVPPADTADILARLGKDQRTLILTAMPEARRHTVAFLVMPALIQRAQTADRWS